MIYFELIWAYIKIGLFSIGGGLGMLTMVEHEVVYKNSWLTHTQFTDMVAISQMTPGPIGINVATYVGYIATGNILGAVIATIVVCLPSILIMLYIYKAISAFRTNKYVSNILTMFEPLTIGLIGAVAINMVNKENFTDIFSIFIFAAVIYFNLKKNVNPIILILLSGVAGLIFYL